METIINNVGNALSGNLPVVNYGQSIKSFGIINVMPIILPFMLYRYHQRLHTKWATDGDVVTFEIVASEELLKISQERQVLLQIYSLVSTDPFTYRASSL